MGIRTEGRNDIMKVKGAFRDNANLPKTKRFFGTEYAVVKALQNSFLIMPDKVDRLKLEGCLTVHLKVKCHLYATR